MAYKGLNDANQLEYPITKMSFYVQTADSETAAFTEVTGFDASVDVIEFRQGNAPTAGISKIPGLVHHGNITLKGGITSSAGFIQWAVDCVTDKRQKFVRKNITIDIFDISSEKIPDSMAASSGALTWTLHNAWVTKLNMPDLDAKTSEVAIISMEVAFEDITYPTFGTTGG